MSTSTGKGKRTHKKAGVGNKRVTFPEVLTCSVRLWGDSQIAAAASAQRQ